MRDDESNPAEPGGGGACGDPHGEAGAVPDLATLVRRLRGFAAEREWQPFHSPKNLAMALSVEAGELLEHFQWLTEQQSRTLPPERIDAVADEVADVLLYLLQLADQLGIDVLGAAARKIERNAQRYPVAQSRGHARKAGRGRA